MKKFQNVDAKLVITGATPKTVVYPDGTVAPMPVPSAPTSPSETSLCSSNFDASSTFFQTKGIYSCFCANCFTQPICNPKINNMLPAYNMAKYDFIFLSDCYIEAESDSIKDVVEKMDDQTGSVCQMHFVKEPHSPDTSFGSVVNKVLFGTQNAKSILFLNFMNCATTVSAAMLVRKEALEQCGGLRAFGCYLAEDFQMGLAMQKNGWKNRLGTKLAWQNPAGTEIDDVFARMIRWKRLRQTTMPILVIAEPLSSCLVLTLVVPFVLSFLTGLGSLFPIWSFAYVHVLAWFLCDFYLLTTINVIFQCWNNIVFLFFSKISLIN